LKKEQKGTPRDTGIRRTVLASLGAGVLVTALPPRWKRPAVESVLLPAHAQTSGSPETCAAATVPALVLDLTACDTNDSVLSLWRVSEDEAGCPALTELTFDDSFSECDLRFQVSLFPGAIQEQITARIASHTGSFFSTPPEYSGNVEGNCGTSDSGTISASCGNINVEGPFQIDATSIVFGPFSVTFG